MLTTLSWRLRSRFDFGSDNGEIRVSVTDGSEVVIHGRIDRVAVEEDDGVAGTVHDYKTSDPTTKLTFDGVGFQLPVYTIAAQRELQKRYGENLRYVDGKFYTVAPPAEVTRKRSLQETIWRQDGNRDDLTHFLDILSSLSASRTSAIASVAAGFTPRHWKPTKQSANTASSATCAVFAIIVAVSALQAQTMRSIISHSGLVLTASTTTSG